MPREKQERIARETREIYAPLANRLGIQWMKVELEDLAFRYLEPEDFAACSRRMAETAGLARGVHRRGLSNACATVMAEAEIEAQVSGRAKHLWSIHQKMKKTGRDAGADLRRHRLPRDHRVGARLLRARWASCTRNWTPVPGRFKDFIALPKPNLYQSLHTTVIGPRAERMEVQIRTAGDAPHRRAGHRGALEVQGAEGALGRRTTARRSPGCAS